MMLVLLFACTSAPQGGNVDDTPPAEDSAVDSGETGDTAIDPPSICDEMGLTARPWDATGTDGAFDTVAPDFTVETLDGDWSWGANFTGCDNVVSVLYHVGAAYPNLAQLSEVYDWLGSSPRNVHYLLYADETRAEDRIAALEDVRAKVETALSRLDDPEGEAWWKAHIHYVTMGATNPDTWIGALNAQYSRAGVPVNWAIDRLQVVREVGYLSDPVTGWANTPPSFLNYDVEYFNGVSDRQDRLDADGATVLRAFENTAERVVTVDFPDAATMEGFDTLELDMHFICNGHPDQTMCGEWDYLAYAYLCDDDDPATADVDESWQCIEMARFITAYARPGRWQVDATPFLAYLQDGGPHVLRVDSANAPLITLDLRLSDQGKGVRPVAMEFLWSGGGFGETYNDGRDPVTFTPPEGTVRVDVLALITGHGYGQDRANCAEFCNHQHEFTVNDAQSWTHEFPEADDTYGCGAQVADGTVPNQYGTWVLGRGGWCPGRHVDPWSADVTAAVDLDGENTIAYRGLYEGDTYVPVPYDSGSGFGANIVAATWLVYYR